MQNLMKIRYSTIIEVDGMPAWLAEDEGRYPQPGDAIYVIQIDDLRTPSGPVRYRLNTTPMVTNSSHEQRVTGWLGATNDRSHHAIGRYTVIGGSSTHMHLRREPEA